MPGGAPNYVGYMGRLFMIYGRNHNNSITFTYSWANGNSSSAQNVSQIVAQHSDGQTMTMSFGLVNGHDEMMTLRHLMWRCTLCQRERVTRYFFSSC